MRTIQNFLKKGKDMADSRVFTAGVLVLIGLSAFGLGRFSAYEAVSSSPKMLSASVANTTLPTLFSGGSYVASKTGSVYYFPWCAGAEKILSKNMVSFTSRELAEKAGYRPAKNCKGMEE